MRRSSRLLQAREPEQAEATARLVIEAYPASAMGHYLLAQITGGQGRPDEAREHYARCLDVLAEDPSLDAQRRELIRRDVEERLAAD